jgi:hypothetical protein
VQYTPRHDLGILIVGLMLASLLIRRRESPF